MVTHLQILCADIGTARRGLDIGPLRCRVHTLVFEGNHLVAHLCVVFSLCYKIWQLQSVNC